ncbi:ABC transporter ATP-binding protein [Bacillus nitratireducens]|uniref:ABC transporter ATP-binding protein n=1 Tax=Bacillus nitratireducens TaxID=2026193 RepID=UPI0011A73542|nr:ATP-binding cassette domain-containing protein [Bacillus nitratireducens]
MIEVNNLTKEFKIVKKKPGLKGAINGLFTRDYIIKEAVKDISFKINQGETVGYIGANGAGKSTTIKMLCGILTPSSGDVSVNGVVPYQNRKKNAANIGVVFGQRTQLFWDIAVRESYELLKHIYSIPNQTYKKNMDLCIEVLNLKDLLDIPVRQLSLGQKMRCELAAAFLHNPLVVFLDEPTIGLDVAVKSRIRSFIKEVNRLRQTTVILTTHDMQDIEEICKRVIIIDQGTILYDGGLEDIYTMFNQKRMIHFDLDLNGEFLLPNNLIKEVEIYRNNIDDKKISLAFNNETINTADIIGEMMKKYKIRDLTVTDPKIESIVKDIYEKGEIKNDKVLGNPKIPS